MRMKCSRCKTRKTKSFNDITAVMPKKIVRLFRIIFDNTRLSGEKFKDKAVILCESCDKERKKLEHKQYKREENELEKFFREGRKLTDLGGSK